MTDVCHIAFEHVICVLMFDLGLVITLCTSLVQQIYVLNEKIRTVLSLAFQNFHTIFEQVHCSHSHFQVDSKTISSDNDINYGHSRVN
jgi:hypothetical protein